MKFFCNWHHLSHYGDLIEKFGPVTNFSTLRYERTHYDLKSLKRNSNNYVNFHLTVHENVRRLRAVKNSHEEIAFFKSEICEFKILESEDLNNFETIADYNLHPFILNKNILRAIKYPRESQIGWFHVKKFLNLLDNVWCFGDIYKHKRTLINRKYITPKWNDFDEISIYRSNVCIQLNNLYNSNDYPIEMNIAYFINICKFLY